MAARRDRDYDGDIWNEKPVRRKSAAGTFLITLLLVVAVGVFCYSGYRLLGYYLAYKAGTDEYSGLNEGYTNLDDDPAGGSANGSGDGSAGGQKETDPPIDVSGGAGQGNILTNVAALEDPATLPSILEAAYHEDATENEKPGSFPVLQNPVNFAELNAVNPDVIGWLRIGAISVSYPVAQAADNDYYLHRTFKKVDNFAGCIFENCMNSPHFTDQNTIIYGHNMKNGSMFGKLKEFAKQETYDKNPYFWIFTPQFIYQYRIFSTAVVGKIGDPYITRFSQEDFLKFVEKSVATSEVRCDTFTPDPSDRIVTLSTCTGNDSTRRILQGRLEQVYLAKN